VDQVVLGLAVTLAELALEELFGQAGSAEPECQGPDSTTPPNAIPNPTTI
jgi:hypothetical protein